MWWSIASARQRRAGKRKRAVIYPRPWPCLGEYTGDNGREPERYGTDDPLDPPRRAQEFTPSSVGCWRLERGGHDRITAQRLARHLRALPLQPVLNLAVA